MIWFCRAGGNGSLSEYFFNNNKIYLPWRNSFKTDLSMFEDIEEYRALVKAERKNVSKTTITSCAGQLKAFSRDMSIDDYVIIPHYYDSRKESGGQLLSIAKISGDYCFLNNDPMKLWHSRPIEVLVREIERISLSKPLQYSIGSYRTIFKIKQEEEIVEMINNRLNNLINNSQSKQGSIINEEKYGNLLKK